jgi:hypothetical protein
MKWQQSQDGLKEQQATSALLEIISSFFCRQSFANKLIAFNRKKKLSKRQRSLPNRMLDTRRMYNRKRREDGKRELHAIAEEKARGLHNETGLRESQNSKSATQIGGLRRHRHWTPRR